MKHSFKTLGRLLLAGLVTTMMVAPLVGQSVRTQSLRPGDVLRLRIYLEPEMSGDFAVDERGAITLPRLGTVGVSEWPTDSIRPRLTHAFAEYLRDPSIEVTVLRRVAVTGSVLKPGLYPVDPTMTVADAVALAGGAAPDGRRDRVELRREAERLIAKLNQSSRIADLTLTSGDRLFVPQKSWLSRNTWLVSTLIGATATVTTLLITR